MDSFSPLRIEKTSWWKHQLVVYKKISTITMMICASLLSISIVEAVKAEKSIFTLESSHMVPGTNHYHRKKKQLQQQQRCRQLLDNGHQWREEQHVVSLKEFSFDNNKLRQLSVRGGGDIALKEDEEDSSLIVTKIRNLIRSFLEIGDRKLPAIANVARSIIKELENVLGVELLPKEAIKKKKKKSKTSSSSSSGDSDKKGESAATESKSKKSKNKMKKPAGSKLKVNTEKHLQTKIKSSNPNYRIQQELKSFLKDPPPNLTVKVGKNLRVWIVTMEGAKSSIYEGETFQLRLSFPPEYPTMPPSVYFLKPHIPRHEHVYTNGDICLSLLGKGWRPTMTAQSIAVSILSILSSARSKKLPMDNSRHAQNKPGQYQKDWVYHDDNC